MRKIFVLLAFASLLPGAVGQGRPAMMSLTCVNTRSDVSIEFVAPESRVLALKERLERSGFACSAPKALPTTK